MMEPGTSALERAFVLARSGDFPSVALIKRRLLQEGYSGAQIEGPVLAKQLRKLIAEASSAPPAAAEPEDGSGNAEP